MTQMRHAPGPRPSAATHAAPDTIASWVQAGDMREPGTRSGYTARLTVDVTPALRGRIKIAAFDRGVTAAEMLRELLEREFPPGAP